MKDKQISAIGSVTASGSPMVCVVEEERLPKPASKAYRGVLTGSTTGQPEQPKSSRQPRYRVQFKMEVSLSLPPICCTWAGQIDTIQVGSVARSGQTERTTLGRAIDSMGNCALSLRFCAVRQSGMMRRHGAGWIQRPDAPSMFTGTKNHSPHL